MRFKTQNESCKTFGPDDRSIPENDEVDDLLSLQCKVLDALEESGHPEFAAADSDPALKDAATKAERKAWLAIYGPLTNVLTD
jgi:hypothetical protein